MTRLAQLLFLLTLLMLVACRQTDEQKAEQIAREYMSHTIGASPLTTPVTRFPTQGQSPLPTASVVPSVAAPPKATPVITPCLSSNNESALTLAMLQNAEYRLNSLYENETIRLTNGIYHRPGTPAQHDYIKLDQAIAYGDLNGDGHGDAAVILRDWEGGTGVFVNLAAVIDRDGQPYNISTKDLGDRVQILSSCILSETITLNMLMAGPNEGFCCPTQQVIWSWKLVNDELVRLP